MDEGAKSWKEEKVINKRKYTSSIQEVKPVITFRAKELFDDLCFH